MATKNIKNKSSLLPIGSYQNGAVVKKKPKKPTKLYIFAEAPLMEPIPVYTDLKTGKQLSAEEVKKRAKVVTESSPVEMNILLEEIQHGLASNIDFEETRGYMLDNYEVDINESPALKNYYESAVNSTDIDDFNDRLDNFYNFAGANEEVNNVLRNAKVSQEAYKFDENEVRTDYKVNRNKTFIKEAEKAARLSMEVDGVPAEIITLHGDEDMNEVEKTYTKEKLKGANILFLGHSSNTQFFGVENRRVNKFFKNNMDPDQDCFLGSCGGDTVAASLPDIPNLTTNIGRPWVGVPDYKNYKGKGSFPEILYGNIPSNMFNPEDKSGIMAIKSVYGRDYIKFDKDTPRRGRMNYPQRIQGRRLRPLSSMQQGGTPGLYGQAGDMLSSLFGNITSSGMFNPQSGSYKPIGQMDYLKQNKFSNPYPRGGKLYVKDQYGNEVNYEDIYKENQAYNTTQAEAFKTNQDQYNKMLPIGTQLAGLFSLQQKEQDEYNNKKLTVQDFPTSNSTYAPVGFAQDGGQTNGQGNIQSTTPSLESIIKGLPPEMTKESKKQVVENAGKEVFQLSKIPTLQELNELRVRAINKYDEDTNIKQEKLKAKILADGHTPEAADEILELILTGVEPNEEGTDLDTSFLTSKETISNIKNGTDVFIPNYMPEINDLLETEKGHFLFQNKITNAIRDLESVPLPERPKFVPTPDSSKPKREFKYFQQGGEPTGNYKYTVTDSNQRGPATSLTSKGIFADLLYNTLPSTELGSDFQYYHKGSNRTGLGTLKDIIKNSKSLLDNRKQQFDDMKAGDKMAILPDNLYRVYLGLDATNEDVREYTGELPNDLKGLKGQVKSLSPDFEQEIYRQAKSVWKYEEQNSNKKREKKGDFIGIPMDNDELGGYTVWYNPKTEEVRYHDKYDLNKIPLADKVAGTPYTIYGRIKKGQYDVQEDTRVRPSIKGEAYSKQYAQGGVPLQENKLQQILGYKDNSPYKNLPSQNFYTDTLTMGKKGDGVSQALLAIANTGQTKIMQPNSGTHYFPGATMITEIPMASDGLEIEDYEEDDLEEMKEGGFPDRYKKLGFKGVNQPKRTPSGGKSHAVVVKDGGDYKLIRFGQQGVSGSPKKEGESEAAANRRKSFKARHAKNIAKGKTSAAYWANKVKWINGGQPTIDNTKETTNLLGMKKYRNGGSVTSNFLPVGNGNTKIEGYLDLESLIPIQTEKDELIVLPDGNLVKVNAKKRHNQMDDDEVTDIVPENSYILSQFGQVDIYKSEADKIELEVENRPYNLYGSNPTPKIRTLGDFMKKRRMKPADLARAVEQKYKIVDHDDPFTVQTNAANKNSRSKYLQAIISLSEYDKARKGIDNSIETQLSENNIPQMAAKNGGRVLKAGYNVPKAQDPLTGAIIGGAASLISTGVGIYENWKARQLAAQNLRQQTGTIEDTFNKATEWENLGTAALFGSTVAQNPEITPALESDQFLSQIPGMVTANNNNVFQGFRNTNFANRLDTSNLPPNQAMLFGERANAQAIGAQSQLAGQLAGQRADTFSKYLLARQDVFNRNNASRTAALNATRANQNNMLTTLGGIGSGTATNRQNMLYNKQNALAAARGQNVAAQMQLGNQLSQTVTNSLGLGLQAYNSYMGTQNNNRPFSNNPSLQNPSFTFNPNLTTPPPPTLYPQSSYNFNNPQTWGSNTGAGGYRFDDVSTWLTGRR